MELTIRELTKRYESGTKALDQLSITFTQGVHGILGPNGAGKSTLLQILTCNLKPTSGDILWNGKSIYEDKDGYCSCLGYMPQQQAMYPSFTPNEYLSYFASLRGMDKNLAVNRIREVLELVNLITVSDKKISTFSGGMKQRLLLAQAILGQPRILLLDEPTAGLDPHQRIALRNIIAELSASCIVLLATHIVSDIEVIAKDILLLKQGKLLHHDTPEKICKSLKGKVHEIELNSAVPPAGLSVSGLRQRIDGQYVARILTDIPPKNYAAHPVEPSLEDVFLYELGVME